MRINNEPEADVDAEPSKTDFSGETKSDVPDGDNPNEFAYSSEKPGVFQPNRAQPEETTEGQEEMPEFENPDLELPAVEGEVALFGHWKIRLQSCKILRSIT